MAISARRCLLVATVLPALFLLSCALPIEQYKTGADNHSWGNDNWQVVRSGSSVTLTAQATFKTPPGLVQIPVPLGDAMTIQHIRGTVSLSVPVAGVNGSIIAMLRDQDGNAIAAVKTQEFGDATATIPVDATLDCHLAVTSVQLEYYVDMPGTQIVSMSLEMN